MTALRIRVVCVMVLLAGACAANTVPEAYSIDGLRRAARFDSPQFLTLSRDRTVFVTDAHLRNVQSVSPSGLVRTIVTFDSPAAAPTGIALHPQRGLLVADSGQHVIWEVSSAGHRVVAGHLLTPGLRDGPAREAQFNTPAGLAVDGAGTLYIVDVRNDAIRVWDGTSVTTLTTGLTGSPSGIAVDRDSTLLVTCRGDHTVVRITRDGRVSRFAGRGGDGGHLDGPALEARFDQPDGIAITRAGDVLVTEVGNSLVRRIRNGLVSTVAGQPGRHGYADGRGNDALFAGPAGITLSPDGSAYLADTANRVLRILTMDGTVKTFAGRPGRSASEERFRRDNTKHNTECREGPPPVRSRQEGIPPAIRVPAEAPYPAWIREDRALGPDGRPSPDVLRSMDAQLRQRLEHHAAGNTCLPWESIADPDLLSGSAGARNARRSDLESHVTAAELVMTARVDARATGFFWGRPGELLRLSPTACLRSYLPLRADYYVFVPRATVKLGTMRICAENREYQHLEGADELLILAEDCLGTEHECVVVATAEDMIAIGPRSLPSYAQSLRGAQPASHTKLLAFVRSIVSRDDE